MVSQLSSLTISNHKNLTADKSRHDYSFGEDMNNHYLNFYNSDYDPNLSDTIVPMILIALLSNLSQLIIAPIYFLLNSINKIMFQSGTWAKFALRPKRLRVSFPRSNEHQLGDYAFGYPLFWGLLFAAFRTGLGWMFTQSIFMLPRGSTSFLIYLPFIPLINRERWTNTHLVNRTRILDRPKRNRHHPSGCGDRLLGPGSRAEHRLLHHCVLRSPPRDWFPPLTRSERPCWYEFTGYCCPVCACSRCCFSVGLPFIDLVV